MWYYKWIFLGEKVNVFSTFSETIFVTEVMVRGAAPGGNNGRGGGAVARGRGEAARGRGEVVRGRGNLGPRRLRNRPGGGFVQSDNDSTDNEGIGADDLPDCRVNIDQLPGRGVGRVRAVGRRSRPFTPGNRGGRGPAANQAGSSEREELEALRELVTSQTEKLNRQQTALEVLEHSYEEKINSVRSHFEDQLDKTEFVIGDRINKTVVGFNSKLEAPAAKDFKYKASTAAIKRINIIRELALKAFSESEREWGTGYSSTNGGKGWIELIATLEGQEEDIRVAEASPLGYKLLEAYQDKNLGFRFVKDKAKATELKKIEAELLKSKDETNRAGLQLGNGKSRKARSRSRSPPRSRRSPSPGRSSGASAKRQEKANKFAGSCNWCGTPGHGYKYCAEFVKDCKNDNVKYDVNKRHFVRKSDEKHGSSHSSGSRDRRSKSPASGGGRKGR